MKFARLGVAMSVARIRCALLRRVTSLVCAVAAVDAPGSDAADGPNILLVTIDTLRADRVGAYGYTPAKTPASIGLAASGVRFADATAHAPLTYPSHVAILTGRYPRCSACVSTGRTASRLRRPRSPSGSARPAIAPAPSSAASSSTRRRARSGIRRVRRRCVSAGPRGRGRWRSRRRSAARRRRCVVGAAKWLGPPAGRPWFLWVHYYDPHLPYDAPAEYARRAPGRPYDGEIAYVDAELGAAAAARSIAHARSWS